MALSAPLFPQETNDVIPIERVIDDGGVIIKIPAYNNPTEGDVLRLFWNNVNIIYFIVGSAADFPKLVLIPQGETTTGNHTTYYSITDAAGNEAISATASVQIAISPRVGEYTVSAFVIVDQAHAGNGTNIILYTASAPDGQIAKDIYLLFSTTGNAVLSATFGQTNANGQYQLSVTNSVAQNVLITATPAITPSIANFTQLIFTQAPPDYRIDSTNLTNNQPANNIAQNTLRARLFDASTGLGVAGQLLLISASGPANYPSLVSTDGSGEAYISFTSLTVGPIRVTIALQSNPSVTHTTEVIFTTAYPVLLGTDTVYLFGNIGLQTFLGPYNITVNHHYHIEPSRQPREVKNCPTGRALTVNGNTCSVGYGRYYTFLDNDLSDVIAIASGAGANLTSERYYIYPESHAGVAEIKVWDYGPYYTSRDALSALGSEESGLSGNGEPQETEQIDLPEITAGEGTDDDESNEK